MEGFSATIDGERGEIIVHLAGRMTIHHAGEVRDALLAACNESTGLTCNLEQVSELDLAGLQLLCATHKSCCSAGKEMAIAGLEREELQEAIKSAGFVRHIGCMKDEKTRCFWAGGTE